MGIENFIEDALHSGLRPLADRMSAIRRIYSPSSDD
jgi:hypothetical protein